MNERPRTIAIHSSLIRPILLMGAQRELVLITAIIAAVLVLSIAQLACTVVGIAFWCGGLAVLQRAAKADPQLSTVYLRHARYSSYYPAQSHVAAHFASIREGLPC